MKKLYTNDVLLINFFFYNRINNIINDINDKSNVTINQLAFNIVLDYETKYASYDYYDLLSRN